VEHTYAYLDGSYGIMNEKQVGIGESTCDARLVSRPIHGGGSALFDVGELAHIALERASTAREAIQIMGDLAYEYGNHYLTIHSFIYFLFSISKRL
jgi:dipeptidase